MESSKSSSLDEVKRLIVEKNARAAIRKKVAPKPLPKDVTVEDILKSLPSEVFTVSKFKSFSCLLVTLLFLSISMYLLTVLPWYLWPVGWVAAGASVTGLFSIAKDCANSSFVKSKLVNYIVGTIIVLPLGYSFDSLKTHSTKDVKFAKTGKFANYIWRWAKGRMFWLSSIGLWAEEHFNLNLFNPSNRFRLRISIVGLYVFSVAFFSVMFNNVGVIGIVKYWLLPWLLHHFLVSTTTLLPSVAVKEKDRGFAVHCDYPKWLEFLSNDISLYVPRNISSAIPHYHLRKAYKSIKQQWGEYFVEISFEWNLLSDLMKSASVEPFTPVPIAAAVPSSADKQTEIVAPPSEYSGILTKINWIMLSVHVIINSLAVYGLFNVPMLLPTIIWAFIYGYATGFGITVGYHRLFAHRAFKARLPAKVIILLLGTAACQESVIWWCRDHRAHHRYTDTNKDPYNATYGFWYSHIGWLFLKRDPKNFGKVSIGDLKQDPWLAWQHKYIHELEVLVGVVFPTCVAGIFWGDWKGGFFFASMLRIFYIHHVTFLVNSLAHYLGTLSYADNHTPRDSVVTAVLTLGEGYHNFHHEFPQDYRNAIRFYQYDPTKWIIRGLSYIGQTYDLKRFPENEIQKGQIQMRQKILDKMKKQVDWGLPVDELPLVTKQVFGEMLSEGYKLVVVDYIIHDVTDFVDDHPGGKPILDAYIGKDATRQFNGEVYQHSNAAHNLLSQLRVGRVAPHFFDEEDKSI
jgi:stearoyl-CoA desaturase (delta-9 desaturase)